MEKFLSMKGITWIHAVNPDDDQIEEIVKKYEFHEIIEQDIKGRDIQDKIDVYDDHIFLIIHFPKFNERNKKYYSNEFAIILGKDFIISICKHNTKYIENIRETYIEEMKDLDEDEKILRKSPYYILYKIIDAMYDKTLTGISKFHKDLTKVEDLIFDWNKMNKNLIEELLIKSRNIVTLKNMYNPQEEILQELNTATLKNYKGNFDVYFSDLEYKVNKIITNIRTLESEAESLSSKYNTLANLKTNSLMSFLTIVTVILGVLTLITGYFGMNVELPMQEKEGMGILIIGGMALIVTLMLWIFRRRGLL